mmetsp:Transcript_9872/g.26818  ORF Transcript_9872/g.26818 Transcript_9872/m.26818 type:complete len:210 (+) Transcript_9872:195-824(+)
MGPSSVAAASGGARGRGRRRRLRPKPGRQRPEQMAPHRTSELEQAPALGVLAVVSNCWLWCSSHRLREVRGHQPQRPRSRIGPLLRPWVRPFRPSTGMTVGMSSLRLTYWGFRLLGLDGRPRKDSIPSCILATKPTGDIRWESGVSYPNSSGTSATGASGSCSGTPESFSALVTMARQGVLLDALPAWPTMAPVHGLSSTSSSMAPRPP